MRNLLLSWLMVALFAGSTRGAEDSKGAELSPEAVLELIAILEKEPGGEKARETMADILRFAENSDKVAVTVNTGFFPWLKAKQRLKNGEVLLVAFVAGNIRPQLQSSTKKDHPDEAVQAMLAAYAKLRQKKQIEAVPELDQWSKLDADGLKKVVAKIAARETVAERAPADDQPAGVYVEPRSKISFPPALGHLKRVDVHKYDKPELGVSIRYTDPDVKADIYIYDAGKRGLGTGIDSDEVTAQFDEAKRMVRLMEKKGAYQNVVQVEEGKITLDNAPGKLAMLSVRFHFEQEDDGAKGKRISHALLTAYKDNFLKIRFTYPADKKANGEKSLKVLLDELGKLL